MIALIFLLTTSLSSYQYVVLSSSNFLVKKFER